MSEISVEEQIKFMQMLINVTGVYNKANSTKFRDEGMYLSILESLVKLKMLTTAQISKN